MYIKLIRIITSYIVAYVSIHLSQSTKTTYGLCRKESLWNFKSNREHAEENNRLDSIYIHI